MLEALEPFGRGIGEPVVIQGQALQIFKRSRMDDAIIANAVFTQIQIGEMRQRLQVLQSHMGDIGAGKVQGLESAQLGNFFQPQIPHARGREGQAF